MVVPLYLAECLSAKERGRGTGVFQWLLTLGIFVAACIGIYYSYHVAEVARTASADALWQVKESGLAPHLLDVHAARASSLCSARFFVSESPRWLFRKGKNTAAIAALPPLPHRRSGRHRNERDGPDRAAKARSQRDAVQSGARLRFAPPAPLRAAFPAGLRHPLLQHRHRHQLRHRLQHHHPPPERTIRRQRPLGLRGLHLLQLPVHHRGHDAGRPQGTQVPLHASGLRASLLRMLCAGALFVHSEAHRYDAGAGCAVHGEGRSL